MRENDTFYILPFYKDKEALLKDIQDKDLKELKAVCRELKWGKHVIFERLALLSTEAYSVFADSDLLLCAGVIPTEEKDIGAIWLLSTKHIIKKPIAYYKACLKLRKRALELFPKGLYTTTASNYHEALKINSRLGFEPVNTIVVGAKEHIRYFLDGVKYGRH